MIYISGDVVSRIRHFNRYYTNLLGLLDKGILGSDRSLSEVRLMLEIERTERCTFARLAGSLNMDGGQLSRLIRGLTADGIICRSRSLEDGRVEYLELTGKGKALYLEFGEKSNEQVKELIQHLADEDKEKLAEAMEYIEKCLMGEAQAFVIRPYTPDDLCYITQRHRDLYRKDYGFGSVFGDYAAGAIDAFHAHRDANREQMWVAEMGGKPVGAVAITMAKEGEAQFRFFFVEPETRGRGIGTALVDTALAFCREKGYPKVFLWTSEPLKAARRIYASRGFRIVETKPNDTWTDGVIQEERWEMGLA